MRITSESAKSVEAPTLHCGNESEKCKAPAIHARLDKEATASNQVEQTPPQEEIDFWEEKLRHYGISIHSN
ncbi:MAG: hypothetical protein K2X81_15370 [Candidatus Obscuribacterales bacterium]|nr:hypothetical protein [Candidatus Obscuribacterales bacterium]